MTTPDPAALNRSMSEKLRAAPAQPLVEGGYALRAAETIGHRSGQRRTTPLAVVVLHERQYLVSPDPSRAWVRNLDADPSCTLISADGSEHRVAVRTAADEAAPVVSSYLRAMQVPWALRAFPISPETDLDEIRTHLDTIAVFRLDSPA